MANSYTENKNCEALDFEAILHCIRATIKSELPESQIILFGSYARGDFNEASDYDLLIVTPEPIEVQKRMPLKTRIRKLLLAQGIFSDILIQSAEDTKRKSKLPGHIIRHAIREGIAL